MNRPAAPGDSPPQPFPSVEPGPSSAAAERANLPAGGGDRGSEATPAYKARVLVVDDDADTAESFGILLRRWGHEVRVAYDGQTALVAADDFLPEVVLLDIGLPAMSGFEVARQLRQRPRLAGTVLVAQTGFGRRQDRERAEQVGFDAYFLKPVDLVVLERFLATLDKSALR